MNTHKDTFSQYSSDHLLQKRALGDELSDEAHKAIEEIFAERGELLPARPTKPVIIEKSQHANAKSQSTFKTIILLAFAMVAMGAANAIAKTWIGVVVTIGVIGYLVFEWLRKSTLTDEQKALEEDEDAAEKHGLNDLMIAAANGDVIRVNELIDYGIDVNKRNQSGATALMYAARNGHSSVVNALISAGADRLAKTHEGSTAASIARKSGYSAVAARIEDVN